MLHILLITRAAGAITFRVVYSTITQLSVLTAAHSSAISNTQRCMFPLVTISLRSTPGVGVGNRSRLGGGGAFELANSVPGPQLSRQTQILAHLEVILMCDQSWD